LRVVPELLEVEQYRRLATASAGAAIARVHAPDPLFTRDAPPPAFIAALEGRIVERWSRTGKVLIAHLDDGLLGVRFGMTGLLELDGQRAIEQLQYASARRDPAWIRFSLVFVDGRCLDVIDPRRLGGVELAPRLDALGPDAASLTPSQLRAALAGAAAPLKARLLDQHHIAGLGNLLCDEALWRAGLDPARAAGSLDDAETRRLHRHIRRTLEVLGDRGGSHLGDLQPARTRTGRCPRDGTLLQRRQVGGRTTYSCPVHQH
jgi:formamidopyrimidine-DNA glycosylase